MTRINIVPIFSKRDDSSLNAISKNQGTFKATNENTDATMMMMMIIVYDCVNDLRQTPRRRSGDDWQTAVNVRTFCRRALPRACAMVGEAVANTSVRAMMRASHESPRIFHEILKRYLYTRN